MNFYGDMKPDGVHVFAPGEAPSRPGGGVDCGSPMAPVGNGRSHNVLCTPSVYCTCCTFFCAPSSGEIPPGIGEMSALLHLELTGNLLSGKAAGRAHKPLCVTNEKRFEVSYDTATVDPTSPGSPRGRKTIAVLHLT